MHDEILKKLTVFCEDTAPVWLNGIDHAISGEQRLYRAVLAEALYDAFPQLLNNRIKVTDVQKVDRQWFKPSFDLSFVCDAAGYDMYYILRLVKKAQEKIDAK